jgi:hypothetical protein
LRARDGVGDAESIGDGVHGAGIITRYARAPFYPVKGKVRARCEAQDWKFVATVPSAKLPKMITDVRDAERSLAGWGHYTIGRDR